MNALRRLLLLVWLGFAAGTVHGFALDEIAVHDLAPQAIATLKLIDQGGPFPHRQDGKTFGNREKILPPKSRGYYREYTVATPGSRTRGARRIVVGDDPPRVFYYTEDHYRSFRLIRR